MQFIITVGEHGKVTLEGRKATLEGDDTLYVTQIGLPTKPERIDDLMDEIRKAVETAAYEQMEVR